MYAFKVKQISDHSPGYKQIEVIDESLFSSTKVEQEIFTFSMVLPDSEAKNYKESEML